MTPICRQLCLQFVQLVLELLDGSIDRREVIGASSLAANMVSMSLQRHLANLAISYSRISFLKEMNIRAVHV